MKRRFKW